MEIYVTFLRIKLYVEIQCGLVSMNQLADTLNALYTTS